MIIIILLVVISIVTIIAVIVKNVQYTKQYAKQDAKPDSPIDPVPLQAVLGEGQVLKEGETSIPQVTNKTEYVEPISAPAPQKIGSPIESGEPKE